MNNYTWVEHMLNRWFLSRDDDPSRPRCAEVWGGGSWTVYGHDGPPGEQGHEEGLEQAKRAVEQAIYRRDEVVRYAYVKGYVEGMAVAQGKSYSDAELKRLRELRICPVCRKEISGIDLDGLCNDSCSGKWDGHNRCVK